MNLSCSLDTEKKTVIRAMKPVYHPKSKTYRIVEQVIEPMDVLDFAVSGYYVFNSAVHVIDILATGAKLSNWMGAKNLAAVEWFASEAGKEVLA
jgi:hypothetical protein